MIAKLIDQHGDTVLINVDNITFAGQAMDGNAHPPQRIIGMSLIVFTSGPPAVVKGTPDEIYGQLRRGEKATMLHAVNGSTD